MFTKRTEKIKKRYNRYALIYDILEFLPEIMLFGNLRKKTLSKMTGKVLEVGVGTGKNLSYYTDNSDVTAIDFSPKMLQKAEKRLMKLERKNIELQLADVQQLPFKDSTFDYVFTTFVFCSVPDPVKGLKEIKRVVKLSGSVFLLKHVLSKNKIKALLQHLFNPITVGIFGFNINRDTKKNSEKAGLTLTNDEILAMGDVIHLFTYRK